MYLFTNFGNNNSGSVELIMLELRFRNPPQNEHFAIDKYTRLTRHGFQKGQ